MLWRKHSVLAGSLSSSCPRTWSPTPAKRLCQQHRQEGWRGPRLTWVPVLIRVMGARILTACRSSTSTSTRS